RMIVRPEASSRSAASCVVRASPPGVPRVAIDRMNTRPPSAILAIRMRSPRRAPPVKGLVGSTATIATFSPRATKAAVSSSTVVDFPTPGGPVSPTLSAPPTRDDRASRTSRASGAAFSTSEIPLLMARKSPLKTSSASGMQGQLYHGPQRLCKRPPGRDIIPASPDERVMRLGLLGGSFNPIHHGHLITATRAAEAVKLDRVLFIPAAVSPLKNGGGLAPAKDRWAMLRLALRGNPLFEAADLELRRGGVSYTIDTLRELRRRRPKDQLHWILGSDAARLLPRWKSIDDVRRLAGFVIVTRPGDSVPRKMPKDHIVQA